MGSSLIQWVPFKVRGDERGSLVAIEGGVEAPFEIRRVYYLFGTAAGAERGFHAHKNLKQVVVAVSGSCDFILDDGKGRRETVRLDSPEKGLLVTETMWREMKNFSGDCVLLVLASERYDEGDYIRDYGEFVRAVGAQV